MNNLLYSNNINSNNSMDINIRNLNDKYINQIERKIKIDLGQSFYQLNKLKDEIFKTFLAIVNNIRINSEEITKIDVVDIDFYTILKYLIKNKFTEAKYNDDIKGMNKLDTYNYLYKNKGIYENLFFKDKTPIFIQFKLEQFPTDIINTFICPDVFDEIVKLDKINEITTSYLSNTIRFKIYYNTLESLNIYIIIIKCYNLLEYFNIKNKNINITLFLTKLLKQIKEKPTRVLTSSEINSGVTIHSSDIKIYIFRTEELEKVILHEVIHALNIDLKIRNNSTLYDKKLQCNFNIDNKDSVRIYEAFTETTAILFNTALNSILVGSDLNLTIENEIKFNLYQCLTIMDYFSINTLFSNTVCFSNNQWKETTSVFAYFVLKTISILNSDEFLEKMLKQGTSEDYYNFCMKNAAKFIMILNNIKGTFNINLPYLKNTMRMTLYEYKYS